MKSDYHSSIVIGTGYSTSLIVEQQKNKNLEGKRIIAFQATFPKIYNFYKIIPDSWTWTDPHSALDGLRFLSDEKNEAVFEGKKKLEIFIPSYLGTSFAAGYRFSNYMGSSPVWRDPDLFEEYYSLLELVTNKEFVSFKEIDCYTTKQMKLEPSKTKDCKNIFNNPLERFILSKPVLGSFEYTTDNSFLSIWGRENKVTSYVFPIMVQLGCKKLGVIGFDFGGSRFYDKENEQHAFQESSNMEDPVYKILKTWTKEWYIYHDMEIYSLVEKGKSGFADILEL